MVTGIHHVTAICGDPQRNLDFYAGLLGLRFVKRTVNFDDPQTYHFYYGDEAGSPGSILTFFPWPGARRGRVGTSQVAVTSFAAAAGALGFWIERLLQHGIAFTGPSRRGAPGEGGGGEQAIAFTDHDGLRLEIVALAGAERRSGWGGAPGIPLAQALRGFHSVTLWEKSGGATERLLIEALGCRAVGATAGAEAGPASGAGAGTVRRFAAGDGGPGTLVEIREAADVPHGTGGVGTVHHVAWRVAGDAAQLAMRDRVIAAGLSPTPVIDRQYFHSVYFREPGGVLFELATDPPGFAIDEAPEHLGERLMLPPQFERHRAQLEAALPPIHLPLPAVAAGGDTEPLAAAGGPEDVSGEVVGFIHRYAPPAPGAELAASTTLLLLHGTGGDEDDLVPLGRALLPGAGLLSPRGKVLEGGMPRFFRRLAEGVFDREDLERRTVELGDFVETAVRTYGLCRDGIVAVGFSNGANIAASLLLRRPGLLCAAILLSPMMTFAPEVQPDLAGTAIFIGAGRADGIAPPAQAQELADLLTRARAEVTVHWEPGGHAVTAAEVEAAAGWLRRQVARRPGRTTADHGALEAPPPLGGQG